MLFYQPKMEMLLTNCSALTYPHLQHTETSIDKVSIIDEMLATFAVKEGSVHLLYRKVLHIFAMPIQDLLGAIFKSKTRNLMVCKKKYPLFISRTSSPEVLINFCV